jgi:antirestriction protein ArdC
MANVYQIITDRICKLVEEKGHLPWQKPWKRNEAFPCNIERPSTPYKGINFWILISQDRKSPYWMTFNQAKKLGGHVKKGEKGTMIVFWKVKEVEDDKSSKTVNVPFLRYYYVYNTDQVDGIEHKIPKDKTEERPLDFNPLDAAEMILDEMPMPRTMIEHGKNAAYYRPFNDKIGMPDKTDFVGVEEYYSTLFHELSHATGHESRCNRRDAFGAGFGRENYSKEELVAEISASFLCHMVGIEKTIDNSAAYLGSWLKRLKSDPKMLVLAASAAQKATDYILDA